VMVSVRRRFLASIVSWRMATVRWAENKRCSSRRTRVAQRVPSPHAGRGRYIHPRAQSEGMVCALASANDMVVLISWKR
jgi:hypothetical protein